MQNVTHDVLYFLDTGIIFSAYIATAFEGRECMIAESFVEELDLQLQINATELDQD